MRIRNFALLIIVLFLKSAMLPQTVGKAPSSPVCAQHIDPTIHYNPLARQARIQAVISVHLTIGSDGHVTDVLGKVVDQKHKAQDILKQQTEEIVNKWTFTCVGCEPNAAYEHDMTFTYKLRDEEQEYDGTTV